MLAEGFLVYGSGDLGIGLGEGERHAVSHKRILRQKRDRATAQKKAAIYIERHTLFFPGIDLF